jgi:hypothetical protein
MTTFAATPAVRAAFAQLIDYAGLFPPAQLDMAPALAEYTAARRGSFAWMLGRFIVPASRIPELLDAPANGFPLSLSVIVDAGNESRTWLGSVQRALAQLASLNENEARVRVEALEIALPALPTQRETYDAAIGQFAAARKQAGLQDVPAFVELPRDARWRSDLAGALFAAARYGLGAKLRCGGLVPQAFPSAEDIAAFLTIAAGEHGLPIKATAGLHHPIRRRDERIGVVMHGFLNVLAAAAFARTGAGLAHVQRIVESQDADELTPGAPGLSADELRETREHTFIGYGSCSFSEPTEDLQALGIL